MLLPPLNRVVSSMCCDPLSVLVHHHTWDFMGYLSLYLLTYLYFHFHIYLRPLQFNYLSYELFLEKKFCQTPKQKKKKVTFSVLRTKLVLKFSVRLQKKKKVLRIFFVRVIQSTTGSYHCCSRASDLRRYTSHPSGYRD